MNTAMDYPTFLLPKVEALYRLARRVCVEIERFQPDAVIGLAHSGWMPVMAAQSIWQRERSDAFPLAMRTNIGLEKHTIYFEQYQRTAPAFCCLECSDDQERLGHYLAWLERQKAWQAELHGQISAARGVDTAPQRLLVVDEISSSGAASFAALGLLDTLYPDCEAHFIAGFDDWTDEVITAWLQVHTPALFAQLQDEIKSAKRNRYPTDLHAVLKPLVTGTEDIAPDRLDWQPVGPDSPAVQALADYLPADEVLQRTPWAANMIRDYVLERAQGLRSAPEGWKDDAHPSMKMRAVTPEMRLLRQSWQPGGLTRRQAAKILGTTPKNAARTLKRLAADFRLSPRGFGGGTIYVGAWDVVPGRLTIGQPVTGLRYGFYPWQYHIDGPTVSAFLEDLILQGVNHFVNLARYRPDTDFPPYDETLQQLAHQHGVAIKHTHYPMDEILIPGIADLEHVLRLLNTALVAGDSIFLHGGWLTRDSTVAVLACFLIERGISARQAVKQIGADWEATGEGSPRLPASEAQHRFILRWEKHRQ